MAKGYNRRKRGFAGDEDIQKKLDNSYVTSTGYHLKLEPVAPTLLQLISNSVKVPDAPVYEAETAYGEVQTFKHDITTIETEEERNAWKAYLVDRDSATRDLVAKSNRALLMKGIVLPQEIKEKFPEWEEEHKWLGIEVPEDGRDKIYHFMMTEILKTPEDIIEPLEKIMALIGMDEETLQAAEDSFRDTMAF